eukprot:12435087-Alexandrium_andersonii.AAC.1
MLGQGHCIRWGSVRVLRRCQGEDVGRLLGQLQEPCSGKLGNALQASLAQQSVSARADAQVLWVAAPK